VCLFAGERLTVNGDAMEDVDDHKIQATAETRLLSNRISVAVSAFGGHCLRSVSAISVGGQCRPSSVCDRKLLRSRSKTDPSAAIAASQMASAEFTTQPGAAPTRRSRNGRKFHVVM